MDRGLRGAPGDRCRRAVKRGLDVVGALVGLVLVLPTLLALAVAVRIEGGPGVIFRQQRVGQHGRVFTLYKFRSLKPVGNEGDVRWNIDDDARLGPVGRFIRRTSLDELPQLVNVLKGDMSLVGPRPERPYFVEEFSATVPGYAQRHRVPVGLTGLAVVEGLRGDTSIEERARVDNLYADTWSLKLDLLILLRTVGAVVRTARGTRPRVAPTGTASCPARVGELPGPDHRVARTGAELRPARPDSPPPRGDSPTCTGQLADPRGATRRSGPGNSPGRTGQLAGSHRATRGAGRENSPSWTGQLAVR